MKSVADVKGLGLGINLQPNAVRELMELGLGPELSRVAIPTSTLSYHNKHGQLIWSEPRGIAAGYSWPQYAIHRGDLLMILLSAVKTRLGPDRYLTGHHFVSFEQDADSVTASFIDRETGRPLGQRAGDILIGADGIHSTVRRCLYPDEGPPLFSGRMIWRGSVEAEPFLDGRTQVMIGHRDQRAVVYPMSCEAQDRGRSLINWAVVLGNRWSEDERENWDRTTTKAAFYRVFENWNFNWIRFADLIAATKEIFEYPKSDRDPLPRWTVGRVTLLGDAAHPMRPVGSQAGSQAIMDARVLAYCVANEPTAELGLLRYESVRLGPMNAVILKTREFGPEIVMQMAEERAPDGFGRAEDVIPRKELEEIAHSFKLAAGLDPAALNQRASYQVAHPTAQ